VAPAEFDRPDWKTDFDGTLTAQWGMRLSSVPQVLFELSILDWGIEMRQVIIHTLN